MTAAARPSPDLLLVRPPDLRPSHRLVVPPVGLLYVASACERAGWRVGVLDGEVMGMSWESFTQEVKRLRPYALGLGGMTPVMGPVTEAVTRLRPYAEKVILGGVHATRFREKALAEHPGVDALVVGEGEEPTPSLLSWWGGGEKGPPPPGVLTRQHPFREAEAPRELDSLALPARHLVPHSRYRYLFQTRPGVTTLITSRGCPFQCTFCDKTVSGSRYRWHSPAYVVNEIKEIEARYHLGYAVIFDDNFTLRKGRVLELCEGLQEAGTRLQWKCEARVDGVDRELLGAMRRAGCRTVAYGVESGNQKSLDFLKKGARLEEIQRAFALTREAGLESVAYVLLGVPGETPKDSLHTLDFCREMGADFVQFSTLSPFPGTELYDLAVREGWLKFTRVRNPADAEERRATLLPPGWSEEDLQRVMRSAYAGFYFRPTWLARQTLRAASNGSLSTRARLGVEMAKWYVGSAGG